MILDKYNHYSGQRNNYVGVTLPRYINIRFCWKGKLFVKCKSVNSLQITKVKVHVFLLRNLPKNVNVFLLS